MSADLSPKLSHIMKHTSILFLPFLLFAFISCTTDNVNKIKVIGVSQCSDDAWRRTMNSEMIREASFNSGIEIKMKTAHDSNQQQIRDIESFIADQVDFDVTE